MNYASEFLMKRLSKPMTMSLFLPLVRRGFHGTIEKGAAIMAKCKDAKDITKLVKIAIRTMINEYKGERALVVLSDGIDSKPSPAAFYGFDSSAVWTDPTVPTKILQGVLERRKVAHFADARAEARVDNSNCNPAVVCVPISGGLLYCDHSKPGYFNQSLLGYIKRLGEEFDQRYGELGGGSPKSKKREAEAAKQRVYTGEYIKLKRHNSFDWQLAVQVVTVLFSLFGFGVVVWMMMLF